MKKIPEIPDIDNWLDRMYDCHDITHMLVIANAQTNLQECEYIKESHDLFQRLREIDDDSSRMIVEIYRKDQCRKKQMKAKRAWHY